MTFYKRYEKQCKIKGILPVSQFAADKLGCSRASISAFAKSGKAPQGSIVALAAKMLNVSSDYLLGITDSPLPNNIQLDDKEIELLSNYRELNNEGKFAAETVLKGLTNQELYKKNNNTKKKVI